MRPISLIDATLAALGRAWLPKPALTKPDRRTLADIGIGRGEALAAGDEIGFERLRRSPLL